MSRKLEKILTIVGAILIIVLAWFLGPWIGVEGVMRWVLFAGLSLIAIGIVVTLWLLRWRVSEVLGPEGAAGQTGDEIDLLIRDAEAKLAAAKTFPLSQVRDLPVIALIGTGGAASTTTMMRSGLDPELLSGQAKNNEGLVAPTRLVNLWVGGQTIFADWAGQLTGDQPGRRHLIRRLMPRQHWFGRGETAPRAALVCINTELLLQPNAGEAMPQIAAKLRETLGEMCQGWGVNLPVYVLFTRIDTIGYFMEYAGAMTPAEAGSPLGTALPLDAIPAGSVYAEAATARLGQAFSELVRSLEDRRLSLLGRVEDPSKLPAAFQFTREFRKLRSLVVQTLVDLGRPSQLSTNPILRGFYFSGVRPVMVTDGASVEQRRSDQPRLATDASGIFRTPLVGAQASHQAPATRKVPQWVFLQPLIPGVILRDKVAFGVSQASTKTYFRKRLGLSLATATALLLGIAWTVSYFKNRALEDRVDTAVQSLAGVQVGGNATAGMAALERLEAVRQEMLQLAEFESNGAPWSYRWGLYSGSALYRNTRSIYFDRFRRLLLAPAQQQLLGVMSAPQNGIAPDRVYEALKAYLMTTSNPDKANTNFLPPVLRAYWERTRTNGGPDAAQIGDLAQQQFLYYAEQLPKDNPLPTTSTAQAAPVASARDFLGKSLTSETIYQNKLAAVNAQFVTLRFNQMNPGSERSVVNNYPVPGAFSKEGWAAMQDAIAKPFEGEQWVLGSDAYAKLDPEMVKRDLTLFYHRDFKNTWRQYLKATSVVAYSQPREAVNRLQQLTNFDSPLLKVICLAAVNTQAADPAVAQVFQPTKRVEPQPGCLTALADPANDPYRTGLTSLKVQFDNLVSNAADPAAQQQASDAANQAMIAAGNIAGEFQTPEEDPAELTQPVVSVAAEVKRVLEEPIQYAKTALEAAAVGPVNSSGANFCTQFNSLLQKYPFNAGAREEATIADLNRVLAPTTGALWQFYDAQLAKFMPRLGSEFGNNVVDGIQVTNSFASFFRRAANVSNALYASGPQPKLSFGVRAAGSDNVKGISLNLNGIQQRSGTNNGQWTFEWPGTNPGVTMGVNIGSQLNWPQQSGLWALSRFLELSENRGRDNAPIFFFKGAGGNLTDESGKTVSVRLTLEMGSNPPIFRPGYLGDMRCTSPVATKAR